MIQELSNVFVDFRWPMHTGIGNVMCELRKRAPSHNNVVDLNIHSKVAGLLTPLKISDALRNRPIDNRRAIFWNPGFVPPLVKFETKAVVTVHDLTHLHFYSAAHKYYYNFVLKFLYQKCDAIVCVSEYTRNEFIDWSGVSEDKVFTVHNGVSRDFFDNKEKVDIGFPYIFYPGNHREYKNLHRLIEAYAASRLWQEGIFLCLTGNENKELRLLAAAKGVGEFVRFLGRLPSEDLPKFYRSALAVVFVSLYEGFGLPIVEAMAAGVPVITSNVSSMPEVGGDAVSIVDPRNVTQIADAMNALLSDSYRLDLICRGYKRVGLFDWDVSAAKFWNIVDQL